MGSSVLYKIKKNAYIESKPMISIPNFNKVVDMSASSVSGVGGN